MLSKKEVNHRLENLEKEMATWKDILETKLNAEAGTVYDEATAIEIKEQAALMKGTDTSDETLEKKVDALEQKRLRQLTRTLDDWNYIGRFGFQYARTGWPGNHDGTELVRKIISEFLEGFHYVLPLDARLINHTGTPLIEFRSKIVDLVHGLTGVKPRLTQAGALWTIHYS
jgi:hypothetical protein